MKFAVASMPPLLMAGTRYGLAGGLLYGFMRLRGEPRAHLARLGPRPFIGICLLGFGNGGTTFGRAVPAQRHHGAAGGHGAHVSGGAGLAERHFAPAHALGGAGPGGGLVGMYLLAAHPSRPRDAAGPPRAWAFLLVLLAALVWSVGSLYAKNHQPAASPFVSGRHADAVRRRGHAGGGPAARRGPGFALAQVTTKSWLAYVYLVTFGSIVAFTAYIWLLRVVEPALAGTYAFVNPVVAVLLGWAFAGEQLNPQMLRRGPHCAGRGAGGAGRPAQNQSSHRST